MKAVHRKADPLDDYSGLELRDFRLMWAVADTRGLTPAAKRLRLTPSALSHQLKSLELWAGVPLFTREKRSMRPTQAGEALLEASAQVLGVVGETEAKMKRLRTGGAGVIRMCTQCYTGYHWLPGVITSFRARFPEVEVRLVAEATNRWEDALAAREVDIVLTTELPREDRNVQLFPTLKDEMKLIMPNDHMLSQKTFVTPEEIAKENILLYADRPENSLMCQQILRPAGVWPERFTSVSLTEALMALVKAGMGVAALASWAIDPQLKAGEFAARRITRKGWKRTWYAAMWPSELAGPLVTAFAQELKKQLGGRRG